jgi:predicted NBD/HSP70 family sugar kinase
MYIRAVSAREAQRGSGARLPSSNPRPHHLRELSEQEVLETIFREGPITRPEIAARMSLSKPTVSATVRRLEQAGLVHPAGPREGRRGRKPMSYMVSNKAGFVVGLDIGGTNVRVAAADIYGEIVSEAKQRTAKEGSRAAAAQMVELVDDAIHRAGADHGEPFALGISTPGVVDQSTGQVISLAYNITPDGGFDPASAIGRRFGFPVLVENNVNLAAVGEAWNGLARGISTFVFMSIGAGVGMGISIDNELVRGAHGAAGEVCYLPSGSDPFDRRHRLHGALEDEVGEAGILTSLSEQDWNGDAPTSAHEVFTLADAGDEAASAIVDRVARHIGVAIATVCAIIDPELVVLGGGIGSNAALLRPVRSTVAALVPIPARIETSLLGDEASLHGAIAIALRQARGQFFSQSGRRTAARA